MNKLAKIFGKKHKWKHFYAFKNINIQQKQGEGPKPTFEVRHIS